MSKMQNISTDRSNSYEIPDKGNIGAIKNRDHEQSKDNPANGWISSKNLW